MASILPSLVPSQLSALGEEGERGGARSPFVKVGVVGYYAPYALAAVLCALYFIHALVPQQWLFILVMQMAAVATVYGLVLRRAEIRSLLIPALVAGVLGHLHFMAVNGALFRTINAVVVSFAVAAHLRGALRAHFLPSPVLATYQLVISFFLSSLTVYMGMAVVASAVMLLQFPLTGAIGVMFLVSFVMSAHAMSFMPGARRLQRRAAWILALVTVELAALLLFLPFLPMVAAALLLCVYAPLCELCRHLSSLPSGKALWIRGSAIAAAWVLVVSTARWP